MDNLTDEIKKLISRNKIEDAFELIDSQNRDREIQSEIILLKSRYNRIKTEKIRGTLRRDEEVIAINKIVAALLSVVQEIEVVDSPIIDEPKDEEKKLKLFISYSHNDESYRKELETSLALLKRQDLVETWSDRMILPGKNWRHEISSNLEDADLILFLISPDFIASDYSYEIELQRAIERHDKQEAILVPIIIRHSSWLNSPVGNFQALPREGKPISSWSDRDEAWLNVYEGIRNVCLDLIGKTKTRINKVNELKALKKFKVGVFGETGTGKSTLCNALLGEEIMRVSDIFPVTRGIDSATLIANTELAIEIIDYPGIGESIEGDKRYEELYESGFEDLDMIIWVLRSDVRNYKQSQAHLNKLLNLNINENKDFILALSMVDRMDTSGIWDEINNAPSKGLLSMIERKTMYVSGILQIPPERIIPISGLKGYNIENLKLTMIDYLENK